MISYLPASLPNISHPNHQTLAQAHIIFPLIVGHASVLTILGTLSDFVLFLSIVALQSLLVEYLYGAGQFRANMVISAQKIAFEHEAEDLAERGQL